MLVPGGTLLVKCQDQVCGGDVRWQTREFADHAESVGCADRHADAARPPRATARAALPPLLGHRPRTDWCPPGVLGVRRRRLDRPASGARRRNYSSLLVCRKKRGRT